MREDATAENELEAEDHGETVASGERRPSLVKLQSMLKKVSQSPFQNQYKTLQSSSSDTSGTSANESQNKQDGETLSDLSAAAGTDTTGGPQLHSGQNAVNGGLARVGGLYTRRSDSSSRGYGGTKASESLGAIFLPSPDFQSSPLSVEPEIKAVENGAKFSEPREDLFQTLKNPDRFQMSPQNVALNGHFSDITLNSPDLFKTQNRSKDEGVDISQADKGADLFHSEGAIEGNPFHKSSIFVEPFKSPANKEDELFWSPRPVAGNPFHTATPNEADYFRTVPTKSEDLFHVTKNQQDPPMKDDLFGNSSQKTLDVFSPSVDPFPSPVTRDLFQDFSSFDGPFSHDSSKQNDPFQDVSNGTADIFQPLSSNTNGNDIFGINQSDAASMATYSARSFNSPSEIKLDMLPSSPELLKATPSESQPAVQSESSDEQWDIVLTTPLGTTQDILQPSPFTRARNLSMSPAELAHVPTFKRPPKPLPRSRATRKEKTPMAEKPPRPDKPPTPGNPIDPQPPKTSPKPAIRPLPKPVMPRKPKVVESQPVDPEDHVLQDVLLIGQEKCVEDWPEDSPQLNPDFKPSGTLRLRRESLKMKADSDGGSGDDQDSSGSQLKKRDKKFRMSLLPRRGSKDKFGDDAKEGKTPSPQSKPSKDYYSDMHMENGDMDQYGLDYKKKPLKTKVNHLLRRASTNSPVLEGKRMNGYVPQESRGGDKQSVSKKDSFRRWSEGTVVDDSSGEEEEGDAQQEGVDINGNKKKKKMKIKFVPHRGFAITLEKNDELKGAHGYTPRKGSKDKSQDEVLGACGYTPRKKSQDDAFEDVEELKAQRLRSTSKAAYMDDEDFQRTLRNSAGMNGVDDPYGTEDLKPKKPTKLKLLQIGRRSSKEDMLDDNNPQRNKSSFCAEELDDDDLNKTGDCKPKKSKHKVPVPLPRKSKGASGQIEPLGFSYLGHQHASNGDFTDGAKAGKSFMSPGEMYDSEEEMEACKPKKTSKLKVLKRHRAKSKETPPELEDPPGAASRDYMSEAAKAEWRAAQMDERALAGMENEEEDGDTDSLMEWWYTVEQWDEVPSEDEDMVIKEDESKSFSILAEKVHRGLAVFNKVFTERAEVLWQSIIMLHAIADDISNFHQKAKIAGITGGTTTAVGGVTAIAGLALAPFTFGTSLILTAVGVGVATAGGITSASAAISDNVNNMHDRKKVETVLQQYEGHLLDIGKILHFVNQGLYKLRGHPFLRSGTQHYSADWEVRRAVQMISLVDQPVMRAVDITDSAVASVQGLFKGIDKYFIKDSRELKKGCKKEVVAQIKEVANVLNDAIVELNAIREELQNATGSV